MAQFPVPEKTPDVRHFLFHKLRKGRTTTTVRTVGQISVITANIKTSRYIY